MIARKPPGPAPGRSDTGRRSRASCRAGHDCHSGNWSRGGRRLASRHPNGGSRSGSYRRNLGALSQAGVGKDEADVYAEGLRRGGAVVSARVPEADRDVRKQ